MKTRIAESIYTQELKSGTNYYLRTSIHGRKKWINLTKEYGVKNLRDAKRIRAKIISKKLDNPLNDSILVQDIIEDWINNKRPGNIPDNLDIHRTQYQINKNLYELNIKPFIKDITVFKFNHDILMKIKDFLENGKVSHAKSKTKKKRIVGQTTYNKIKTLLRSSLKDYVSKNRFNELFQGFYAPKNFTTQTKRKKPLTVITNQGLEQILRTLYQEALKIRNQDTKYQLLMTLLTAHRGGEIAQYRIRHYDQKRNIITIPEEITKTENFSKIFVPMIVRDYIHLRLQNTDKDDYIFKKKPNTIAWNIKKIFDEKIQTSWGKGIGNHITRELFATITSDRDISFNTIQLILSHTPTSITGKYYINSYTIPQLKKMEKALLLYERIANGTVPLQENLTVYSEPLTEW